MSNPVKSHRSYEIVPRAANVIPIVGALAKARLVSAIHSLCQVLWLG